MENMKSLPHAQAWAHQSRHILHNFYQDIFPDTCCLLWSMLRKHTLRNKTRSGWCWCLRSALSDGRLFLGCCAGCCCSWAVTTAVLVFLVGTVDETSPYTFYKAERNMAVYSTIKVLYLHNYHTYLENLFTYDYDAAVISQTPSGTLVLGHGWERATHCHQ